MKFDAIMRSIVVIALVFRWRTTAHDCHSINRPTGSFYSKFNCVQFKLSFRWDFFYCIHYFHKRIEECIVRSTINHKCEDNFWWIFFVEMIPHCSQMALTENYQLPKQMIKWNSQSSVNDVQSVQTKDWKIPFAHIVNKPNTSFFYCFFFLSMKYEATHNANCY